MEIGTDRGRAEEVELGLEDELVCEMEALSLAAKATSRSSASSVGSK